MQWRLPVVVALVLLAGCGSLFSGDAADAETLTPAPVPAPETDDGDRALPPGVSGGGELDVDALSAAHRTALVDRSYVWREWRDTGRPEIESASDVRLVRAATVATEGRYRYWADSHVVNLGQRTRFVYNYSEYVTGGVAYARLSSINRSEPEYRRLPAPSASQRVGDETTAAIGRYLSRSRENVTVSVARGGGTRLYRVEGHGGTLPSVDPVRNYSVTAVVSADGFVRSLDVRYRTVRFGGPSVVRYRYEFSGVGETTVEPPDWLEENRHIP